MNPPIIDASNLNILSGRLEQAERQFVCLASLIYKFDTEMREVIGLTQEVAERQLAILRAYTQIPPEYRQISFFAEEAAKCKAEMQKQYLADFEGAIGPRSAMPENGKIVPLTPQKRNILSTEFLKRITHLLNKHFDVSSIDERTNLIELQNRLQETANREAEVYQILMDQKEQVGIEYAELAPTMQALKDERARFKKELTTHISNIFTACQLGSVDWLRAELQKIPPNGRKAFVNQVYQTAETFFTPLHTAAFKDHASIIPLLLEAGASVTAKDKYGYTPLHFAAKQGANTAVNLLLLNKTPINTQGEYGRTPLIMAAFNGRATTAALLLQRGANPNIHNHKKEGEGDYLTPLHEATLRNQLEVIQVLVESPLLNVMETDIKGRTAYYYAFEMGLSKVLELLLAHRSWCDPIHPQDPNRLENLLKLASRENHGKVIEIIHELQRRMSLKKQKDQIRLQKLHEIDRQIKQFELEKDVQLKSNGVSRGQRFLIIKEESARKKERLLEEMEEGIEKEMGQFEKQKGKERAEKFDEIPL